MSCIICDADSCEFNEEGVCIRNCVNIDKNGNCEQYNEQ